MIFKEMRSTVDQSVNFVHEIDDKQALEARYVRRHDDYVACYLSTQTGCAQACRMCHLTATGQNEPHDATVEEIIQQAKAVLSHLNYLPDHFPYPKSVHYNFMARGEPLVARSIIESSQHLFPELGMLATTIYNLRPRFLISTIMPETLNQSLVDLFPVSHPEIYYSLYSLNPEFRRRWLPRAMDPERALDMLAEWQYYTKKVVKIHFALIEGVNDSQENALEIAKAVNNRRLRVDYALVRYNPPSEKYGRETSEEGTRNFSHWLWANTHGARIKQVDRVGPDVAASCGMFVS
jgi:23S rRNA (adenine2503-C2)-methyltransferase